MMDIEEIRQSPRQFVDLETVEWLSARVMVLEMQLAEAQQDAEQFAHDTGAMLAKRDRQLLDASENAERYSKLYANALRVVDLRDRDLAECQAALALKDEALKHYMNNGVYESTYYAIRKALTIKSDNAALREWGARLLEGVVEDQIDFAGGTGLLPHELNVIAERLCSGEWTPEVMK